MTTAMQDLINYIQDYIKTHQQFPDALDIKSKANYLLNKEKEQMFACFRNGFVEGMSQHAGLPRKYKEFEDYYNTIFNNNAT